jgi:putative endonuclease
MLNWLQRLLRRRDPEATLSPRTRAGRRGERAAVAHLKGQGYRILERNFTTRLGEVDIVAFRRGLVAFVEVRSQNEPVMIDPAETVTRRKQLRVIKAAQEYCTLRGLPRDDVALRFDVITVRFAEGRQPEMMHIEGAFGVTERGF